MGIVANIAQLTGMDVLSVIVLISEAANNARMHKSDCRLFAQWLTMVENVLRPVINAEWIKIPENQMILERLEGALGRARDLVESCGNRSYPYLVVTRCVFAKRLNNSRAEIESILLLFQIAAINSRYAFISETQKAATERFKELLDEETEDIKYKDFVKKHRNDSRFKDLDHKRQKKLFNERMNTIRKGRFKDLLRERGDIDLNSRFSQVEDSLRNDPIFKAVKKGDRTTLFNELVAELGATQQDIESGATERNETEVEISPAAYMHNVLRRMVDSLQKILCKPACTRDVSQSAHDN